MSEQQQPSKKQDRLKSALRDNLKKRKALAKKLNADRDEDKVKLRDRALTSKTKS